MFWCMKTKMKCNKITGNDMDTISNLFFYEINVRRTLLKQCSKIKMYLNFEITEAMLPKDGEVFWAGNFGPSGLVAKIQAEEGPFVAKSPSTPPAASKIS